jgi:hypothetical protein
VQTLLIAAALCQPCKGAAVYDALNGSGQVDRAALGAEFLNGGKASQADSLVNFSAYTVPVDAANPLQHFSGTLTLADVETGSAFFEVNTHLQKSYKNPAHLPKFSFQFIQVGTHIFPLRRGLIVTDHPDYEYILEPGRVWQEVGDHGYSRASIPFSLQEKGANCTHNGALTFLFKSDGQISNVAYQIAGETCQYFQFNMWGLAAASYTPETIADAARLTQHYKEEVSSRMPVRSIADLAKAFPSAGVAVDKIAVEQTPAHTSLFGVVIDGVNYVGGCQTRYGSYPFCEVLDVPSYSLAKSIVGAFGLMRMEKKFPGSKDLAIGNLVPSCSGRQWSDVTLLNALDMATGNYMSDGYETDENSAAMERNFFLYDTNAAKSAFACSYQRKSPPGTTWVYHTADTFLLGAAMNAAYKSKEGSSRDFYTDMLVEELFKPLQLSPTVYTTVRTFDADAVPFTGYGLTLHRDDLAKIGEFLSRNQELIDDRDVLDRTLLREALQKTPRRGLLAGAPDLRYLHGFWAWDAASTEHGTPLCAQSTWIPFMSGFGGIGLVLLPGNMVYYFVSDNHEYGFKSALVELNKIRPLCLSGRPQSLQRKEGSTSANIH